MQGEPGRRPRRMVCSPSPSLPVSGPAVNPVAGRASPRSLALLVVLLGFLAGVIAGQWSAGARQPSVAGAMFRIPDVPADLNAEYRAVCEAVREEVVRTAARYPSSVNATAAAALFHYLLHDPEGEIRLWQRCLEIEPNFELAYSRLVSLWQQNAEFQKIVDLLRRSLQRDPSNATHRSLLGSALLHLNRFDEARQVLEDLLRGTAGTADTYLVLGKVYEQLKRLDDACRCLEAAVALDPQRPDALYSLATVCAKRGEKERAAYFRQRFEEIKKANLQTESKMGARHEMEDQRFAPLRGAEILCFAARAALEGEDTAEGERLLLKAAELSPGHVECRRMLSTFYETQGRPAEALRWVAELRRLEPNELVHAQNEAVLYVRLQRWEDAERVFREICRLAPANAMGYAGLAELYLRTGRNLPEARRLAEQAVALQPTAWRLAVLAALAERSGDLEAARAALRRAMALEPNDPKYREMYDALTGTPSAAQPPSP